MRSLGRDLYPSRHTRHTTAPWRSSSSSSEMSSTPSMDVGDRATARISFPRGDAPGVNEPASPNRGGDAGGVAPGGVDPPAPGLTCRVKPISASIFSLRSIAFRIDSALVAARSLAVVSAASASARSIASSASSARVPTPPSATDSSACNSARRSDGPAFAGVVFAGVVFAGVVVAVAGGLVAVAVSSAPPRDSRSDSPLLRSAPAAARADSKCPLTTPRRATSAAPRAGLASASAHASLVLSSSRAPGFANATSSRYPVTSRTAPRRSIRLLSFAPASSRAETPSATEAAQSSSSASAAAPGRPGASASKSRSFANDAATLDASVSADAASAEARRGRTRARVSAGRRAPEETSSESFPRNTRTVAEADADEEARRRPDPEDDKDESEIRSAVEDKEASSFIVEASSFIVSE